jgi:hypothetical protein
MSPPIGAHRPPAIPRRPADDLFFLVIRREPDLACSSWIPEPIFIVERRQHLRVFFDAWVHCLTSERRIDHLCCVCDVSLGGMLLQTPLRPLPAKGDLLEARFSTPPLDGMSVECEVVGHYRADRFAVRFLNLSATTRKLLEERIPGITDGLEPERGDAPVEEEGPSDPPLVLASARQKATTQEMDREALGPLLRATGAGTSAVAADPGLPLDLSPLAIAAQGPRAGSSLEKALRAASGEFAAAPGPSSPGREVGTPARLLYRDQETPRCNPCAPVTREAVPFGDLTQVPLLLLSPNRIPWQCFDDRVQAEPVIKLIDGTRSYADIIERMAAQGMDRATSSRVLAKLLQLRLVGVVP